MRAWKLRCYATLEVWEAREVEPLSADSSIASPSCQTSTGVLLEETTCTVQGGGKLTGPSTCRVAGKHLSTPCPPRADKKRRSLLGR